MSPCLLGAPSPRALMRWLPWGLTNPWYPPAILSPRTLPTIQPGVLKRPGRSQKGDWERLAGSEDTKTGLKKQALQDRGAFGPASGDFVLEPDHISVQPLTMLPTQVHRSAQNATRGHRHTWSSFGQTPARLTCTSLRENWGTLKPPASCVILNGRAFLGTAVPDQCTKCVVLRVRLEEHPIVCTSRKSTSL